MLDKEETMDFKRFLEEIETKIYLYIPAEYKRKDYRIKFENIGGVYRLRISDSRVHLTELPHLELTRIYEDCGRTFDTDRLQDILRVYFRDYEKAQKVDQKEQKLLNRFLEEFPEQKLFSVLIPGMGTEKEKIEQQFPGRTFGNAYLFYAMLLEEENGKEKSAESTNRLRVAAVSLDMMRKWGVQEPQLYSATQKNMYKLFPYDLEERGLLTGKRIFIISSLRRCFGLSTLFYEDGPMKELAMKQQTDFYVLPLSVHEAVAVPLCDAEDMKMITGVMSSVSPFNGEIWYYNHFVNQLAFTREEYLEQKAILAGSIMDAAERRMADGIIR